MTKTNEFNQNRRFGVEFETITKSGVTRGMIAVALRDAGIDARCEGYQNNTENDFQGAWLVKRDGSLYGQNGEGAEIVSPPLKGSEGLEQVKKVLRVVNSMTKVNRTCGMHIHHEATDLGSQGVANLYRLYWLGQEHISMMLAPSRRGNGYCAELATNVREFESAGFYRQTARGRARVNGETLNARASQIVSRVGGHHVALNFSSLTFRGTVEFRQHQGTTEYPKFEAWLIFTQRMVEKAVSARTIRARQFKTLWSLLQCVGLIKATWGHGDETNQIVPDAQLARVAEFLKSRSRHFKTLARRANRRAAR